MNVHFIDFQIQVIDGEYFEELCLMNVNDALNPYHEMFKTHIPWTLFSTQVGLIMGFQFQAWNNFKKSIIYVLDDQNGFKMSILKNYFPYLRFISYKKYNFPSIPNNIRCFCNEHESPCAFKNCLSMCLDYLKC